MRNTQLGFIRQQGFTLSHLDRGLYTALMFQPRMIAGLVLVGAVTESPWLFVGLSAALSLSAIAPTRNPFNAIHNRLLARAQGLPLLEGAPAPRRFAMGIAAGLTLATAVALFAGAVTPARILEGLFAAAVTAVIAARFCTGSYLYHLLWGQATAASACVRV